MKSVHRWAGIAATATTLAAGTLLFPGGVASALPTVPGNNLKTTDINFSPSCWIVTQDARHKILKQTSFTGGADGAGADQWGVQITAPETVARGQEFTYRIQPDPITVVKDSSGDTILRWTEIRYGVDIPPGTELVKAEVASDSTTPFENTPTISRIDSNGKQDDNGSILQMGIGTGGTNNGGTGGGWFTKANPGFLTFPAMDITLKAGDAAGTVIEPTLRISTDSDPDANTIGSDDNFFTAIAVPKGDGGIAVGIPYNIRCAPLNPPALSAIGSALNPDGPASAGGMPLTSIKVIDSSVFGLDGRVLEPVDIPGNSTPHIQMKDFVDGSQSQHWVYTAAHEFRNPATDKCIDVVEDGFDAGGQRNGSQVILRPCQGNPGQKWTLDPAVTDDGQPGGAIVNEADGKCMDVTDSASADGVQVQIWDCAGAPNQQWNFPSVSTTSLN
ncbi:RICIN domain-containing protein [Rhodococcus marinonascens]|uniref:RICIN domain-containing protein n=1 Tax=Rhodococcus marinonascens TaxID=38311 RepID=UPI0009327C78|nr:RICIN domain-containing protein [Rhodococcus marinonascens]